MHRIQRIPKGSTKRHTSDVTLIILPYSTSSAVLADPWDDDALGNVREEFYRGSGRGGQRRNKVSTAVRLVHVESGIEVRQESGRRQVDNRRAVRERLLSKLAEAETARQADEYRGERSGLRSPDTAVYTHNEQRSTVKAGDGRVRRWKDFYAGEWK